MKDINICDFDNNTTLYEVESFCATYKRLEKLFGKPNYIPKEESGHSIGWSFEYHEEKGIICNIYGEELQNEPNEEFEWQILGEVEPETAWKIIEKI